MSVTSVVNEKTQNLQLAHIAPVVLSLLLKKSGISVAPVALQKSCVNAQDEGV